MGNCAACKNLSKTWDASQNLIVTRFNNKKDGSPTLLLVQEANSGEVEAVTIKVRYCPWCGKDLMNDNE